jgi:hypothetical protein
VSTTDRSNWSSGTRTTVSGKTARVANLNRRAQQLGLQVVPIAAA